LPVIDEVLYKTGGRKSVSPGLDVHFAGFWQPPVREEDIEKNGFRVS
jgi:hypothetical protein